MKAMVMFTKCIQDSQEYGSDSEHMVSRVFFDLGIDGREVHRGLYADLKQVVGSNFETGDIEVGRPVGYNGPFNYIAFRDAAEQYFRALVGVAGRGIRIGGGSNIRMWNNTFHVKYQVAFDIDGSAGGTW